MASQKRRRYAGRTLTILLVLILAVLNAPFPVKTEVPALEIKLDDPSYVVERTITVSGSYHINAFKENSFHGQISVSEYFLTSEKMVSPIYLSKESSPLEYYSYRTDPPSSPRAERYNYTLGYIAAKPFMGDPIIMVLSENPLHTDAGAITGAGSWGNWSEEDGVCIVPYAKNRDEAISTLIIRDLYHPEMPD